MRSVQFAEYGGPEVLHVAEVDEPHAGPGQVRIAAQAAGVNGIDWKIRSGAMRDVITRDLPSGIGGDAAGVVDEVGDGVTEIAVGDAVFGAGSAAYSEYVVLDDWAAIPDGMPFDEAAGLPSAVETAFRILSEVGASDGDTIVVNGASGGVGSAVTQIAHDLGATVIGLASAANLDYLRELGAVPVTYGDGFVERVRGAAPGGVDIALDIAGSGVIAELIELTGDPQRVLSIADFGATDLGARVSSQPVERSAAFTRAAELYARGRLRLPVQLTFPLEEAGRAQRVSQLGHARGRVVLTV